MRSTPVLALLLAAAACANGQRETPDRLDTVRIGDSVFRLRYRPEDAEAAKQVEHALRQAVPAARRWARLSAPVLVTIHPTHQALETAARREGHAWLRAWTRHASIELQSPRTWSRGSATDAQVAQLLTHEITHCVMYQSASGELTWTDRQIPLWFREGMASVTAAEPMRASPQEIRRFYEEEAGHGSPGADPLTEPGPLYRSRSGLVYGTAHGAFRFLLDRYGEERIRRLLSGMGRGSGFGEAFQREMGIAVQDFERAFKRQVAGWGSGGHELALAPARPGSPW